MATLSDAVSSASNETDLFEYMSRVKTAVIESVQQVDSRIEIRDTGYFNHSAIPDLVLKWSGRPERPMYVRRSMDEIVASHDVERLAPVQPVLLAVGDSQNGQRAATEAALGVSEDSARNVLVTDAGAIDALSSRSAENNTPIRGAVTSAILPSGHGLLDAERAAQVLEPSDDIEGALSEVLSPEAVAGVSRLARVMSAAMGGALPANMEEQFSVDEVKELLPWLLRGDFDLSSDFWTFMADRVTLKQLEAIAPELEGMDLSRLCRPGASRWEALRASLGLKAPEHQAVGQETADGWFVRGKLLTCEVGNRAFRFTSYGQAIKEHGSTSSATWDLIRPGLRGASTRQIVLRGITRSIRVNAEESADVQADVDSILESVQDTYYVDEVTARYGLTAEERLVRLVVGDGVAYNEGRATVRDLLTSLARIASYREPVDVSAALEG